MVNDIRQGSDETIQGPFKINVPGTFPIFEHLRPPPPLPNKIVPECPTFADYLELMSPINVSPKCPAFEIQLN